MQIPHPTNNKNSATIASSIMLEVHKLIIKLKKVSLGINESDIKQRFYQVIILIKLKYSKITLDIKD